MQIQTKAIVFKTIKYSDTSFIVRCYTESSGLRSYIIRGILKNRKGKLKPAYFQPLNQLELTASHNNKKRLNSIKEVSPSYVYETLHTSITKQFIVFFLTETLSNSILEEEGNKELFSYIETSLKWLDIHDKIANFHLFFLINLTKYLGFYPDLSNRQNTYFNLSEGSLNKNFSSGKSIFGNDLIVFKELLGTNIDSIEKLSFNNRDREYLLDTIIAYFELHLEGFKRPKSMHILKNLFGYNV